MDFDDTKEKEIMSAIINTTKLAQASVKAAEEGNTAGAKELFQKMNDSAPNHAYIHQNTKEYRLMRKWTHYASTVVYGKQESIVIDLGKLNGLNEFSVLSMLGGWTEMLLGSMFSDSAVPVKIKGPKGTVDAYAKALGAEKRYVEALRKYGLDNPQAIKSKSALDKAIAGFQKETGILWPFGD